MVSYRNYLTYGRIINATLFAFQLTWLLDGSPLPDMSDIRLYTWILAGDVCVVKFTRCNNRFGNCSRISCKQAANPLPSMCTRFLFSSVDSIIQQGWGVKKGLDYPRFYLSVYAKMGS